MTIQQAIIELLKQYGEAHIPTFGTLKRTNTSAKINVITNHFTPPNSNITFTPDNDTKDKNLVALLANNENIDIDFATTSILDFATTCKKKINEDGYVVIEEIGKLIKKYDGNYVFETYEDVGRDLNTDSFGLPDFYFVHKETKSTTPTENNTKEPLTSPDNDKITEPDTTTQDQKDTEKTTPPTKPTKKHKSRIALIILLPLLLLAAAFVLITYLELIPNYIPQIIKPHHNINITIGGEPNYTYYYGYKPETEDTTSLSSHQIDQNSNDSVEIEQQHEHDSLLPHNDTITDSTKNDTTSNTTAQTVQDKTEKDTDTIKVKSPAEPSQQYLIVYGCFSIEDNANRSANILREKGHADAFYKKRGSLWNVYYGTYYSNEEANKALEDIRKDNPKAWLIKTK